MTDRPKYQNPPPARGDSPPPEVVELEPQYDWGPTPPPAIGLRPVGRPTRVALDPQPPPADAVVGKLWAAVAADIEPWARATRPAVWSELADAAPDAARRLRVALLRDWLADPFFAPPSRTG